MIQILVVFLIARRHFYIFPINNFDNTIITLRILDSYKHLSSSLDVTVKSLLNKDTGINSVKSKFPSLFQYFDYYHYNTLKLLRKRVYPYDNMNENWENKLKEKELPDIKYFNSSLSNTKCCINDYSYEKEIYNYFKCKNIKDYDDFHVKTDILLLADVFASYRKDSYDSFGLDFVYCISDPGFSNRARLK